VAAQVGDCRDELRAPIADVQRKGLAIGVLAPERRSGDVDQARRGLARAGQIGHLEMQFGSELLGIAAEALGAVVVGGGDDLGLLIAEGDRVTEGQIARTPGRRRRRCQTSLRGRTTPVSASSPDFTAETVDPQPRHMV
jgi:hypothetical protein